MKMNLFVTTYLIGHKVTESGYKIERIKQLQQKYDQ